MVSSEIEYNQEDQYIIERRLIYLYLFFLIFEGAFRKWIFPGLSSFFVIIRDPIVLLLVIRGYKNGFLNNKYCFVSIFLSLFSFSISFVLDKTNLLIQYYGTRIFLLYFPAIFVIGNILTQNDIYKIGKFIIYLSMPMTVLIVLQYFSPQSAWVNRGVGGDMDGSGFGGVLGYARPSAVFSFTQGFTTYLSVVFSYLLIFFYDKKARKSQNLSIPILVLSLICYLICIPASISRTVLFQTVASLLFLVIGLWLTHNGQLKKTVIMCIVILLLIPLLMTIPDLKLFMHVYLVRFENAANSEGDVVEGTILNRWFGAFFRAWLIEVPILGHGIGQGSRLAYKMNHQQTLITDEEWTRIIYESGFALGTVYILLRVCLTISLLLKSFRYTYNIQSMNAILFLPCVLFLLPQGSFGNAVPLGFCVLLTGILIAIIQNEDESVSISSDR